MSWCKKYLYKIIYRYIIWRALSRGKNAAIKSGTRQVFLFPGSFYRDATPFLFCQLGLPSGRFTSFKSSWCVILYSYVVWLIFANLKPCFMANVVKAVLKRPEWLQSATSTPAVSLAVKGCSNKGVLFLFCFFVGSVHSKSIWPTSGIKICHRRDSPIKKLYR